MNAKISVQIRRRFLFHRDSVDCFLRSNDQNRILNTKVRVYPCFPLTTLQLLHFDRRLEHLKTLKKLMWISLEIDQAEMSAKQWNLSFLKNFYMLNTFPLDSSICLLLTSESIVLSQRLSPSLKTFTIFFINVKSSQKSRPVHFQSWLRRPWRWSCAPSSSAPRCPSGRASEGFGTPEEQLRTKGWFCLLFLPKND